VLDELSAPRVFRDAAQLVIGKFAAVQLVLEHGEESRTLVRRDQSEYVFELALLLPA